MGAAMGLVQENWDENWREDSELHRWPWPWPCCWGAEDDGGDGATVWEAAGDGDGDGDGDGAAVAAAAVGEDEEVPVLVGGSLPSGKLSLARKPRNLVAATSYAMAASSAVSNVPSQTRAAFFGSRISAAHLPHGRWRTPRYLRFLEEELPGSSSCCWLWLACAGCVLPGSNPGSWLYPLLCIPNSSCGEQCGRSPGGEFEFC